MLLLFFLLLDLALGAFFIQKDINNFRCSHYFYHHGMVPMSSGKSKWGDGPIYPVFVNSLGFLDESKRQIPLTSLKRRIVFIGDSFAEGLGLPFEKTFVGHLNKKIDQSKVEILNAAVLSYSPKLYHLKIKYLIEKIGLKFDELYVFIDISDVQDEILYRSYSPSEEKAGEKIVNIFKRLSFAAYSIDITHKNNVRKKKIKKYTTQLYPPWLDYFWLDNQDDEPFSDPNFIEIRSDWTTDKYFNNKWTKFGLELAVYNMDKLHKLCNDNRVKLTIVVYPWIQQIYGKDLESKQVQIWESYSVKKNIGFINLFPSFIKNEDPDLTYAKYFIQGDVHWNVQGHLTVANKILEHLND